MFGKKLGKRERRLLSACIILATGAILYGAVIEPITANWKTMNTRSKAKAAQLGKDAQLLKMYETIKSEYDKYREFIEIGKNEEEELTTALAEIENVAKQTDCRIANVKPRATRKRGNYKEISVVITAEGNIEKLAHFLHSIETSRKLLRIRHFSIIPKAGSSGELKATFLISKIIVG